MSVQDKLLNYLTENLAKTDWITANEVAEIFDLSRNTASHHLNRLVEQGTLHKSTTRPTKFSWAEPADSSQPFEQIIGSNGSLKTIINKCKAAVDYPKGLPILLAGRSGTGKSFLAREIYEYAKKQKIIRKDAPFIVLNCADYANNPELLSSVLFGHVKGAFTGADQDKKGLIAEAENGYLFLDEVHNLSAENQEKLFLLIDFHKYRRLGDNETWQQSSTRLIMATTEDIQKTFLETFIRRIPFEVTLPDYNERPYLERVALVQHFFSEEAENIGKPIQVANQVIENLIKNSLVGNIGQLKNKIRVLVAENISGSAEAKILMIPAKLDIAASQLFSEKQDQAAPKKEPYHGEEDKIYRKITNYQELCGQIDALLFAAKRVIKDQYGDLELFFQQLSDQLLLDLKKTVTLICQQHGLKFSKKDFEDLLILLAYLITQGPAFKFNLRLLEKERMKERKYLTVAEKILHSCQVTEPVPSYLLAAFIHEKAPVYSKIPAIVAMHGANSATSIAATANALVQDYVFDAFDMPIDVSSTAFIEEIIEYIKQVDTNDGIIVLVDMGSLSEMYTKIAAFVAGDLLIMNNTSTALALEIAFKLKKQEPMKKVVEIELAHFNVAKKYFEGFSQKENILITCMSGEGIAVKIKEIIAEYLDSEEVELLTMDYHNVRERLEKNDYAIFKDTVAILSSPKLAKSSLPIINIENVVNGSEDLNYLSPYLDEHQLKNCTNKIIKLFTIEGASARLTFLNPERVINEVDEVITAYEDYYQIEIESFLRINLFLHLSSMIERILKNDAPEETIPEVILNNPNFSDFIEFSNAVFANIRKKYNIHIPKSEYALVFQLIYSRSAEK